MTRNPIQRDGSINPAYYDIVEGCHLWNRSLLGGRPTIATNGQRIYIRHWVTQAEPGRRIRATCHNHCCINPDHLVVEPTISEITAAMLARVPHGTLNDDDRALLEQRASGMTVRAMAEERGLPFVRVAERMRKADMRMHRILAALDRNAAAANLAQLTHEVKETPGEREVG